MDAEQYLTLARIQDEHWFYKHRRELIAQLLAQYAAAGKECAILDFGAGMGANVPVLSRFGNVTCYEPKAEAAAYLAGKWPGTVVNGAALESLVHGGTWRGKFDVILVSYVLYHRGIDDPQRTLALLRECA